MCSSTKCVLLYVLLFVFVKLTFFFFIAHTSASGSLSCTYLPPSLHRCPALFGILAEWLHSHHLGQLAERVSASDLTCS